MTDLTFLVPGSLSELTGGTIFDQRIIDGLTGRGWQVSAIELPWDDAEDGSVSRQDANAALQALPDHSRVVADGLLLPSLSADLARHADRLRVIALVHLPVSEATAVPEAHRARQHRLEAAALEKAARIIVPSRTIRQLLIADGLAASRIGLVQPGTDACCCPATQRGTGRLRLLCVAAVTVNKGHAVLFEALAQLAHLDWTLDCVGSLERDPDLVEGLRKLIDERGLADRIRFTGEQLCDALAANYHSADIFVLASDFESYGMALAEALAHGLPIVSTTGGAIAETVPGNAGLLVAPGDAAAFTGALEAIMTDPARRHSLKAGAVAAGKNLPTWVGATERFAAEVRRT